MMEVYDLTNVKEKREKAEHNAMVSAKARSAGILSAVRLNQLTGHGTGIYLPDGQWLPCAVIRCKR